MTKQEQKLALDMLSALMDVLEQHNIPSKYYAEFLGSFCDEQAVSILTQELEAAQ
jgi:hypothetical protein